MSEGFPYCRAASLPDMQEDQQWLVEGLWTHQGVGIIGGIPKCCKSWLGLDLAVSVASGTPCLGRYKVSTPGAALCFLAEDPLAAVKTRLRGICTGRGLNFDTLPIEVITAPSMRLDVAKDQQRLSHTVATLMPRLLLLDPFVRLHRIDENDAGQVSGVLAYLRTLQREHNLAVVVVHHARKNGTAAGGQALRGSSDFHAWGDSNLYMRRGRQGLLLTMEHRMAAAPPPLKLRLALLDQPHLEVTSDAAEQEDTHASEDRLASQVLAAIKAATSPMTRSALRAALRVRNERLGDTLTRLTNSGAITRVGDTWTLPSVPVPHLWDCTGNGTA